MSKSSFKYRFSPDTGGQRMCDHPDCNEPGLHRAPKSRMTDRGSPDDYHWFCMPHVREYNKSWNFFDGMSDDEVLRYKDEDITGHRPTWKLGSRLATPKASPRYDDPFEFQKDGEFGDYSKARRPSGERGPIVPELDPEHRAALATMNLQPGCSLNDIKKRRKELAKKYHPDVHGGDKKAEETLKNINQAYSHLLSSGQF